jgi:hypothetical protein
MSIDVNEYFEKVNETKDVELESGYVFKIRKITTRDLINEQLPLMSNQDLTNTNEEKKQIIWQEMTKEEKENQMEFNNMLIEKALVEPIMTREQVRNIPDADYFVLLNEVTEYSLGGAKTSPLPKSKVV